MTLELKTAPPRLECPWNLQEVVAARCKPGMTLLALGIRAAEPILPLREAVKEVICVEPDAAQRERLSERVARAGMSNVTVLEARGPKLPVEDSSIDLFVQISGACRLPELERILRRGGAAVVEKVGERSHTDLRAAFKEGMPEKGDSADDAGDSEPWTRLEHHQFSYAIYFDDVHIEEACWSVFQTREALERRVEDKGMARGCPRSARARILDAYEREFGTERGIRTEQHRLLIVAEDIVKPEGYRRLTALDAAGRF